MIWILQLWMIVDVEDLLSELRLELLPARQLLNTAFHALSDGLF